ncbi:MAG: zinc-binding dehydrogenase [Solirubrobacteraceae bacterium]
MRALLHDPDAEHGLRLGEAVRPEPGPSQVAIRVAATSLNFGEVAFLSRNTKPGDVAGWDAAGTVIAPAADGSGPQIGARVVTFGWSGAWAQERVVDIGELAVLPDAVDFATAAAIPVAGVTALRAVRRLGALVGRRALVTGASGGVGRFAVQLAARAGAHVIASVGSTARGEGLPELGAAEVVVALSDIREPLDGVLENVGGRVLADALALTRPGGTVLSIGMASLEPTTIDFEEVRHRSGGTRIEPFVVGSGFAADLPYLMSLLAAGELDPQIGWRGPWERAGEAAAALLGRQVRGKAILEVTQ